MTSTSGENLPYRYKVDIIPDDDTLPPSITSPSSSMDINDSYTDKYLIKNGYIPYLPNAAGAHPFDRLVASRDKRKIFIADTKTKSRRKYYPDTGINIRHYNEYKYIQDTYGIDVFIFFVDEEQGIVYGNLLKNLDKSREIHHNGKKIMYPLEQGGIRYFSLENMITIADIPDIISKQLKQYTSKKDAYKAN